MEKIDFNSQEAWSDLLRGVDLESLPPTTQNLTSADFGVDDLVLSVLIGSAGALSSIALAKPGVHLHKKAHQSEYFGHGNAPVDSVRGYLHRLRFGHDILNPQEVFNLNAEHYGSPMKGLAAWLSHLFMDSFSKEGMPLPGSSYFRDYFEKNGLPDKEVYQKYLTIKGRDIAGSMLVEGLIKLYLSVHTKGCDSKQRNSTRESAVRFFSHSFCVFGGLSLSPKSIASANWPSVGLASNALFHLLKNQMTDSKQLEHCLKIIERNQEVVLSYGSLVNEFENSVLSRQKDLSSRIESLVDEDVLLSNEAQKLIANGRAR
ncbi:MAG: hypothetical protein JSU04_20145 [Bdellovibrionales bacterium]|nr:hypothetical protein [Bdellovibrionales bacterium]